MYDDLSSARRRSNWKVLFSIGYTLQCTSRLAHSCVKLDSDYSGLLCWIIFGFYLHLFVGLRLWYRKLESTREFGAFSLKIASVYNNSNAACFVGLLCACNTLHTYVSNLCRNTYTFRLPKDLFVQALEMTCSLFNPCESLTVACHSCAT